MFSFNLNKIDFTKQLHASGPWKIYEYKGSNAKKWAAKLTIAQKVQEFLDALHETILTFNLDHSAILPVKGYLLDFDQQSALGKIYTKIPRVKGSLSQVIDEHNLENPIPKESLVKYCYSIAKGLSYLHARKIAHRDLTPDNILLDEDQSIRITNLGCLKTRKYEENCNKEDQPSFEAPELSQNKNKLKVQELFKADIWSLGIVMLKLNLLRSGFIEELISEQNADIIGVIIRNELKDRGTDILADLIIRMLKINPDERIRLDEIQRTLETEYGNILNSGANHQGCPQEELTLGTKEEAKLERKEEVTLDIKEKTLEIQEEAKDGTPNKMSRLKDIFKEIKEIYQGFDGQFDDETNMNSIRFKKAQDDGLKMMMEDLTKKLNEASLSRLKQLRLSLEGCKHVTNNGIETLAEQIGTNYKNLIHLRLDFRNCALLGDEGVKALAKKLIPNLNNLGHLHLNFDNCNQIKDEGALDLVSQIGESLKNLENLLLNFECCTQITNKIPKEIGTVMIPNLSKLKAINLGFRRCVNITNQSLEVLFSHDGPTSKTIQHIFLDFMNCNQITDKGIAQLSHCIASNMTSLKNFTLKLRECENLTDKGMKAIADSLGTIASLNCFCIEFLLCRGITGQGIRDLVDRIKLNLTELQYLQLDFPRCQSISDEGINELVSYLGSGKADNLVGLSLNFTDCENISDGVFKQLASAILKQKQKLTTLALDFEGCSLIKKESKESAQAEISAAKSIPQLFIR